MKLLIVGVLWGVSRKPPSERPSRSRLLRAPAALAHSWRAYQPPGTRSGWLSLFRPREMQRSSGVTVLVLSQTPAPGVITMPQTGGRVTMGMYLSQPWGPGVQGQATCRFRVWGGPASWLTGNRLLAASSHNGRGSSGRAPTPIPGIAEAPPS